MNFTAVAEYERLIISGGHVLPSPVWRGELSDDWKKTPHDFCILTRCVKCDEVLVLRQRYSARHKVEATGTLHQYACPLRDL